MCLPETITLMDDCGTISAEVLLCSLEPTDHACQPKAAARVVAAMSRGYHECFHEAHLFTAGIRATVLRRIGYQTLLEPAFAGWLVLARATPISPRREVDPALDLASICQK